MGSSSPTPQKPTKTLSYQSRIASFCALSKSKTSKRYMKTVDTSAVSPALIMLMVPSIVNTTTATIAIGALSGPDATSWQTLRP